MFEKPIKYGAIAIDNCIYKSLHYRFEKGALAQMSQFKNNNIIFLQTDIIHNESIKHISDNLEENYNSIKSAMREISLNSCLNDDEKMKINNILKLEIPVSEKASDILKGFYEKTGSQIIKTSDLVDIGDVINIYFSNQPPFEKRADKKNEFPDVFALLALEAWAEDNDTHVLAVSNDNGWVNYAKTSERITVERNLPSALSMLQKKDITELMRLIIDTKDVLDFSYIESEVESSLYGLSGYVDADSPFNYDYDDVSVSLYDIDYLKNDGDSIKFEIVRVEDDSVTIKITGDVTIDAEASFNFYVTDSIDHDDVFIGGCVKNIQESYNADIFITMHGDFREDDPEDIEIDISDVDVVGKISNIHFGFVEPDYSPDDYDD